MKKIILTFCIFHSAFCISNAQLVSLDSTFGNGGKVFTHFGPYGAQASINSIVLQIDGKILVAGSRESHYGVDDVDILLSRYNSNGALDNTFGIGGIVVTDINYAMSSDDYAYSVIIQADEKIVVAGKTEGDFALLRYNSNGSLDNTFGIGGIVITDLGGYDYGRSVAIQTDGKIVVAGENENDFALARYKSNGILDSTFDNDGKVTTDFVNWYDGGYSVVIQSDGKIIVTGSFQDGNSEHFALARYNNDGSLDDDFGTGGKVITVFGGLSNLGNAATSVAIQSDGKIMAAGYFWPPSLDLSDSYSRFALARYNNDGSLDSTFDADGIVITPIGTLDVSAYSSVIQSDGKIILIGWGYPDTGFILARYNTNGSLDNSFGTGGIIITNLRSGTDRSYAVAIQSDGKILAAGESQNDINWFETDFALVRYNNNSCTPPLTPTGAGAAICLNNTASLSATGTGTLGWYNQAIGGTYLGGGANYTTPILNTTTTYYVQDSTCVASATRKAVLVTVNALPVVTANASDATICEGTTVILTGGGASSYVWSGGITNGVGFVPTTTITYTVTGTNGNNCSNTATKTINVNPLPTVTANASATNVCEGEPVTLTGGGASSYTWSGGVSNGIGFIPATTTTYTVTGTDGNNCSNTATKTIHVNPLPTVTAIASATDVCEGTIVTLTGGGAASYIWSDGISNGVAFVTSTTTTYTVTGTDANNCSNTATKTITVTPLLDLTTSLSGLTISANQNGAIYQWLDCNNGNSVIAGETYQSYTASINGNYSVIVKMNSCSDTSTCVNVSITGIEKTAENNIQLKVFPNPGNGSITITLSGVEGQSINEGIYTIKNESGQMIQTFKLNTSNNYTVNIENLSNGIYFIVGLNGNQIINQKVVIAK